MPDLFSSLEAGSLHLSHRVVMAPLTRMRAKTPGNIPWSLNAEYYRQRASEGGLIISEAAQVDPLGQGRPATPGLHEAEQVDGWRLVTDAVHSSGGLMVAQLSHAGRVSHSSFHGMQPVGPSSVRSRATTFNASFDHVDCETPHALTAEEISVIVRKHAHAAANALDAGFDGLEIHGADGHLADQFMHNAVNQRTDRYGGSIENRTRLLLEIVDAVLAVSGRHRVGVRLSPWGKANDVDDSNVEALFRHVIKELDDRGVAYLHLAEPRAGAGLREQIDESAISPLRLFRPLFRGVLIASGGFDRSDATDAVASGTADAVAFGRKFIANPDLPQRLRLNAALNPHDRATFYGGGAAGYTDYPALTESEPSSIGPDVGGRRPTPVTERR